MSWEDILKSDVEKIKQNFINYFNLQGADTGNILETISDIQRGRHSDAVNEILEVSGLDANNPSNRNLVGQALNEIKQGKMPSQTNVQVDPKTKIPWKAPASDPTAISQKEVDNPTHARIREGRGD
jgi:hypothetical protein